MENKISWCALDVKGEYLIWVLITNCLFFRSVVIQKLGCKFLIPRWIEKCQIRWNTCPGLFWPILGVILNCVGCFSGLLKICLFTICLFTCLQAEDHRDLTTAFSEFASAISSLITIADCPNSISPPSTINPKIPENPPRLDNAATASPRKTPDIIIAPSNSPPGDPYDVTPTNELADQLESAVTSQSQRVASQANRVTSFASLYPELDMKIDEFLASSQPPTSIEILLERLKRPQSIHIFQKLIGRSKSTPGSLNEVSNVGRLRPLRVPKDLKGASWNWRIKRSFNNLTETQPNTPMIPRRPKNKRKFMRDDLDRCKSVPLTKEEIQSLSR